LLGYSWLKFELLDEKGRPRHHRGVSVEPGIYFLGLPWQSRRGSSFIWGVWHDAKHVADHISTSGSTSRTTRTPIAGPAGPAHDATAARHGPGPGRLVR
jgi:hypothetical protein